MRLDKIAVLDAVRAAYGDSISDCDDRFGAMGWTEVSSLLGVTVRHCQCLFSGTGMLSSHFLEDFCGTTYVVMPPTRMSVLWTGREAEDENWDRLGRPAPIVCRPEVVARCRKVGGPHFVHVVDLWKRFPDVDESVLSEINGGYAMVRRTKARLIPVCWDTRKLLRMNRFRKQCDSIAKAAAGSGLTLDDYLEIKSPTPPNRYQGVLSIVAPYTNA